MNRKNLWMAAAAAAFLTAGNTRAADEPVQERTQAKEQTKDQMQDRVREQDQARERQRLQDGSGQGSMNRYGAGGERAGAREGCDGTMRRDRFRDGSGAGARQVRTGGRR